MNKIYISELVNGFIARQLPFVTSLYDLLASSKEVAGESLIELIHKSLTEFEKSYVFIFEKEINIPTDGIYTFTDNYDDFVNGSIIEDQVELIPKVVHTIGGNSYAYSSSYWEYKIPQLKAGAGKMIVRGFYPFRLWYEMDAEGLPTSDSHIYGMDRVRKYPYYKTMFDYTILKSIQQRTNIVNLGSTIDILRLDSQILELKDQIEENASTSCDIYDAWR